jgi:hypothetical protein
MHIESDGLLGNIHYQLRAANKLRRSDHAVSMYAFVATWPGPLQVPKPRSISTLIATPASAAATPIQTVSTTVLTRTALATIGLHRLLLVPSEIQARQSSCDRTTESARSPCEMQQ